MTPRHRIKHRPRDLDLSQLPPQLKMLIRILGAGPALTLVEERGGTTIWVPKKVTADYWMMGVLGAVAFGALVAELASHAIELPKYDSVVRQWRHQRVAKMRRDGIKLDVIALHTGYTRRHVINILRDLAEDNLQLDLFAQVQPQASGEAQNDADAWLTHDLPGALALQAV